MTTRQSAEAIEDEAADWLARIDRHGRTPELQAELEHWLAGDTRRRGALLQAEAAWNLLVGDFPVLEREDGGAPAPIASGMFSRRRLIVSGGAAALAASVAGGVLLIGRGEDYDTAIGEIRRVPLADGSVATINSDSRLSVALEAERRIVRLNEGEAWFQVAHDKARPFIAEAGRIRVRAVGTAFAVRRREDGKGSVGGAEILVTEGVVEAWADGAEGQAIRLTAGQRAFVADNAAVTGRADAPAEVTRALAWRAGQIDLAGESLAHALAEFNRYNGVKLVLTDRALANEPLYGVFRVDDPQGFADALHRGFDVPVKVEGNEIRIGG
ncbi:FecR family protein [Sphingomonas colocasiae]|uniref:FecR domain-containing protein n=1 Tax=Sphingomonas colocasiae TaxID=1848973 RepID=A0ABS7PJX0_9SPHN|nr:FecR domain-containing protein [Sphingomonas colocasiae]MBY8821551.1 FecR domain-containing protein [Sphingomonas colocasiae]